MKKKTIYFGILIYLCLFPAAAEAGNTYYVATNGNDMNAGTLDSPWLTIQHGAETMVAGDTVFIKGGTYNENVLTVRSGNATDGYIKFSAYPGERPIIDGTDGTGVTTSDNGFIISKSYIKLTGLEICNWNENGIWVENADHIEISDCEVHHVTYGIGIGDGTYDFQFNRVVAHHFDLYGFDVSPAGGAACYNGTFNDCIAHTGRDPSQNVDGFALSHQGNQHDFVLNRCETHRVFDGFDLGSNNVTVYRSSAHHCSNSGFKIWGDNVSIINSLSYRNDSSNVELDWNGFPGTTTLQNCTLMDSQTFNIWVENSGDSLHMYNCILAGGDNIGLAFEQRNVSNYRGDYNLFHNDDASRAINVGYEDEFSLSQIESGAWTTYSGQDAHSLVVNSLSQLFVDPATFDLHLMAGSPAVDNGTNAGAPVDDFEGNTRPQGAEYDRGAYEFSSTSFYLHLNSPVYREGDRFSLHLTCRGFSGSLELYMVATTPEQAIINLADGALIEPGASIQPLRSEFYSSEDRREIIPPVDVPTGVPAGHYVIYGVIVPDGADIYEVGTWLAWSQVAAYFED